MLVLQDPESSLRMLVIEVVFENQQYFATQELARDFVPLLLKEMARPTLEPAGWILRHFTGLVNFILDQRLLDESTAEILRRYFQVSCRTRGWIACAGVFGTGHQM